LGGGKEKKGKNAKCRAAESISLYLPLWGGKGGRKGEGRKSFEARRSEKIFDHCEVIWGGKKERERKREDQTLSSPRRGGK